jgi:hypothetical protein
MKLFRLISVMCVLFTFMASVAYASDVPLPAGWRVPNKNEMAEKWRNDSQNKYLAIKGDFNNDGIIDNAMILVNDNEGKFGLFAFVSEGAGAPKSYMLNTWEMMNILHNIGIKKRSPGTFDTACKNDPDFNCVENDEELKIGKRPHVINIEYDAIELFSRKVATSYIFWNKDEKKFYKVYVWVSEGD